jgi:hypothetical protein
MMYRFSTESGKDSRPFVGAIGFLPASSVPAGVLEATVEGPTVRIGEGAGAMAVLCIIGAKMLRKR